MRLCRHPDLSIDLNTSIGRRIICAHKYNDAQWLGVQVTGEKNHATTTIYAWNKYKTRRVNDEEATVYLQVLKDLKLYHPILYCL